MLYSTPSAFDAASHGTFSALRRSRQRLPSGPNHFLGVILTGTLPASAATCSTMRRSPSPPLSSSTTMPRSGASAGFGTERATSSPPPLSTTSRRSGISRASSYVINPDVPEDPHAALRHFGQPCYADDLDISLSRELPYARGAAFSTWIRDWFGLAGIHRPRRGGTIHAYWRLFRLARAVLDWQASVRTPALFVDAADRAGLQGVHSRMLNQADLLGAAFDGLTPATWGEWNSAFGQLLHPADTVRQNLRRWLDDGHNAPSFETAWRSSNRSAATLANLRLLRTARTGDDWIQSRRGRPTSRDL
jgi:hypothetical protein